MDHHQVQKIAKDTIAYAKRHIIPGMKLTQIRQMCEDKMLALGADSFWYWDIGAFVFAGDDTALSVSGRSYTTIERIIAPDDIITIDLSPQCGNVWGDYARTIVLQNGVVAQERDILNDEWRRGLEMEAVLHEELFRFARPETTFEELYYHMNDLIRAKGFVNLDFAGNLGHSIVRRKEDRIYTEKGNRARLGDVECFTFEPHIGIEGSPYGYKKEDIYFFENGVLREM